MEYRPMVTAEVHVVAMKNGRAMPIDPSNFRKFVDALCDDGILERLNKKQPTATKPAATFKVARSRY